MVYEVYVGKNTRGSKEFTREQRLSKENKQLKREISKLQKMLARIDLDPYTTIKDVVEEHQMEDKVGNTQYFLDSLKDTWKCHDCDQGYLEIVVFNKVNGLWYFRACNSCPNRTKSQKYTTEVKGLIKKQQ